LIIWIIVWKWKCNGNGTGHIKYWKGKKIIPLSEWKKNVDHVEYASHGYKKLKIEEALKYFPDQYNDYLFVFGVPEGYEDKAGEWYCDYRELHEHILIEKYGIDTYKKMIEEANYQHMKEAYYFHDSSWDMRGANGYDGKGCTGHSCIPECEYFKPALHPELLPLLKVCKDNRELLRRSLLTN
jgi:hypothetical protein